MVFENQSYIRDKITIIQYLIKFISILTIFTAFFSGRQLLNIKNVIALLVLIIWHVWKKWYKHYLTSNSLQRYIRLRNHSLIVTIILWLVQCSVILQNSSTFFLKYILLRFPVIVNSFTYNRVKRPGSCIVRSPCPSIGILWVYWLY